MQNTNPTAELEQILDQAAADIIPEPPTEDTSEEEKERIGGFHIKNEEQLTWAARKYANAEQILAEAEQAAKAQMDRINAYVQKVRAVQEGRKRFFEGLCADFLCQRQVEDKKLKGIPTPYGRVQSRAQQPEWNVQDKSALVEGIKAAGVPKLVEALIQTKEEPKLADIKELAKAGTDLRMAEIGKDFTTGLPIFKVQARQIDIESGEVAWIDLPGLVVVDRPAKVTVEVGK